MPPLTLRLVRLPPQLHHQLRRTFSLTPLKRAEGDTGSHPRGGERTADAWSRREKASEDMYIRNREKEILQLLREKISLQEEALRKDREVLERIENQYGRVAQEREAGSG